ncbi:PREDICTED: protein TIFY 6B-like isoform X2 [Lupinus angustifolius]|uniref:protein TIFY 6B-like isoform X2 n=1 Tax=Lupinus angustifolius TaxID=3871 RepID=UPI00092E88BD|nr:PREDICTED: protein TIFY 6B-like isoform X2 [Lupinus angustifolius]
MMKGLEIGSFWRLFFKCFNALAEVFRSHSVRGSEMQWSFSNKGSGLSQHLSLKGIQEDRQRKTVLDSIASSGYMTISSNKDAFMSTQKPFSSVRNFSIGKQTGNQHGITVYPQQCFDAHSSSHQESVIFSVSNQSNQASPVLQSSLTNTGSKMINSAIKPQPFGSKSSATPVSALPSIGCIVGSTDLRNSSKSSVTPAQLTIFYGGSVCVYDDVSPEKAQAIMLLAGNGTKPIQNMTLSTPKLQSEITTHSNDDCIIIGQSFPSPLPSPLPLTSRAASRPCVGSSSSNELTMLRPTGPSTTPSNHLQSPKVVGSAATKMVQQVGGLPQARKASLARFLEKRKERVIITSPYYMNKKSPECSNNGSSGFSFSITSSDSCPLPAIN